MCAHFFVCLAVLYIIRKLRQMRQFIGFGILLAVTLYFPSANLFTLQQEITAIHGLI